MFMVYLHPGSHLRLLKPFSSMCDCYIASSQLIACKHQREVSRQICFVHYSLTPQLSPLASESHLKKTTSLVVLNHVVQVRAEQASACDPGLRKYTSASHLTHDCHQNMTQTHIKHGIFHLALAAQHKQRREVVRLHNGKVSGVICISKSAATLLPTIAQHCSPRREVRTLNNVVWTRTIRTRRARETNLEDTRSAIRRVRRRGGPDDVHSLVASLAGVVDGHSALVLFRCKQVSARNSLLLNRKTSVSETYVKRVLRLDTLAACGEGSDRAGYLVPFS